MTTTTTTTTEPSTTTIAPSTTTTTTTTTTIIKFLQFVLRCWFPRPNNLLANPLSRRPIPDRWRHHRQTDAPRTATRSSFRSKNLPIRVWTNFVWWRPDSKKNVKLVNCKSIQQKPTKLLDVQSNLFITTTQGRHKMRSLYTGILLYKYFYWSL